MKVLIKGERNFFLFQDIVYYFILTLKRKWRFPIRNKYEYKTCSHFIYDSWKDVLNIKIFSRNSTILSKELQNGLTDWMVTTNIAILTAQKETGRRSVDRYDMEYLEKYKPAFKIEHTNNFNDYIVHLDSKMEILFNCAVSFYESFLKLDYVSFLDVIKKYFEVEEKEITEEMNEVVNGFICDEFVKDKLNSYEIMEV